MTAETVTETRRRLAAALARDLRQMDLEVAAVFVERQQDEIERLRAEMSGCENCSEALTP
jgi:hypothetical protein